MPGENFDIKITGKKFIYGLLNAMGLAGLSYTINFLGVVEFPSEYVLYVGFAVAMLRAAENAYKHWNDGTFK